MATSIKGTLRKIRNTGEGDTNSKTDVFMKECGEWTKEKASGLCSINQGRSIKGTGSIILNLATEFWIITMVKSLKAFGEKIENMGKGPLFLKTVISSTGST